MLQEDLHGFFQIGRRVGNRVGGVPATSALSTSAQTFAFTASTCPHRYAASSRRVGTIVLLGGPSLEFRLMFQGQLPSSGNQSQGKAQDLVRRQLTLSCGGYGEPTTTFVN